MFFSAAYLTLLYDIDNTIAKNGKAYKKSIYCIYIYDVYVVVLYISVEKRYGESDPSCVVPDS